MKLFASFGFLVLTLGAISLCFRHTSHVSASNQPAPILYTAAAQYQPLAWLQGAERFPQGAQVYFDDGHTSRLLAPGFAAAADPSISPDATQILFAGKHTVHDPWQIWEVAASGGEPKQLTTGTDDHIRPFYLPDNRIVYARREQGRFVLEAASADPKETSLKPTTLSFAPGNFLPTAVLKDGRILFSATFPLGLGSVAEIYTVYSDGSGMESYRCDHNSAPDHTRYAATQLSSGDIVFTHGRSLARFTSAMAHEVAAAAPNGEYAGDVAETAQAAWLISWRAEAKQPYELKLWTPGAKELTPAPIAGSKAGLNLVEPVVLAASAMPRRFPSALHEWHYANLLALDAHTSRETMPSTEIHSVRVYALDGSGKRQTLGTAPVEKDGSFYIRIPGDRPIRFELLDGSAKAIRAQHGWMWARSGEQRICVGCHAGPEHAPKNAVPEILNRSTIPADLTGGR